MTENGISPKKTGYKGGGPRFGIEKPAIPGPGRPPLSPEVKIQRKELRKMIENIAPQAIATLRDTLDSVDEKNRVRAAEILLSHSVPRLEEVINDDERPLQDVPNEQLESRLRQIEGDSSHTPRIGLAS